MNKRWTFGARLAAAFTLLTLIALAVGGVGIWSLRTVITDKDKVIDNNTLRLRTVLRLGASAERRVVAVRGFLLVTEDGFIRALDEERRDFERHTDSLRALGVEGTLLGPIEAASDAHLKALDGIIADRRADKPTASVLNRFNERVVPAFRRLRRSLDMLEKREEARLREAQAAADRTAETATWVIAGSTLAMLLLALVTATLLIRGLGRQIGGAVGHMQSAAVELHTNANQQAGASREQVSAVGEMTTTMKELLAASRQISARAESVSAVARDAAKASRSGRETIDIGGRSVTQVKKQVDTVVEQMLELGRKALRIGGVLDVINELSDQTNILAVNASIEAAAAGEHGIRFAALADEIRKLADRVSSSTREIRTLIDEVRASVNSTVMATESGAKAADAATGELARVVEVFAQIDELIDGTATAARQIELSTQQQATAAEQVTSAAMEVSQTVQESEAASAQTVQAASQLSGLAAELGALVGQRSEATA